MSLRKQWNITNSVINDNTKETLCILYLMTVLVVHTMAQNESLI